MERMSQRASTGCALDPRGCINLESILSAFNAPISEEQAWALCYTFVQCYFDLRDEDKSKVVLSTSLKHVILHKDGFVHQDTFIPMDTQGRPIFDLGGAFFFFCFYPLSLLFAVWITWLEARPKLSVFCVCFCYCYHSSGIYGDRGRPMHVKPFSIKISFFD